MSMSEQDKKICKLITVVKQHLDGLVNTPVNYAIDLNTALSAVTACQEIATIIAFYGGLQEGYSDTRPNKRFP